MENKNIYIIQNHNKVNLVSIYSSFIKSKLSTSEKFQIVSVKDKFQRKITLKEILEFDTTAQSLTVDTKKYISKMISKHNNEFVLELYKEIPDLGSFFDEISKEQKVIFSFLRSIIKDSKTILVENMDGIIRKDSFKTIKKSINQMAKESKYNFIIETNTPEFWSDICSHYVRVQETSVEFTKNKLDMNELEDSINKDQTGLQIAL